MGKRHRKITTTIENFSQKIQVLDSKFDSLNDEIKKFIPNKNVSDDPVIFQPHYNDDQINKFLEFNNKTGVYYLKVLSIIGFFIFLLLHLILPKFKTDNMNFNIADLQVSFNYDNMQFDYIFFMLIFCAWALNFTIAIVSHKYTYAQTAKGNSQQTIYTTLDPKNNLLWHKALFQKIRKSFTFILSPDLFFANVYKGHIKSENIKIESHQSPIIIDGEGRTFSHWNTIKIYLQDFIIKSNWMNICISIVITILIVSLAPKNIEIMQFLFICVCIRLISRGLEIAIAFYKDVVTVDSKLFFKVQTKENDKSKYPPYLITSIESTKYFNGFKSSLLREGTRLSLAVHSLLELFITFALAFYLLFNVLALLDESYFLLSSNNESLEIETNFFGPSTQKINIVSDTKFSISEPSYLEAFLFSSSLGLFNISYVTYQNILISILHFYQLSLSAILILLSVARYLTNDKTLSPQDERLYNQAALKNYIQANSQIDTQANHPALERPIQQDEEAKQTLKKANYQALETYLNKKKNYDSMH